MTHPAIRALRNMQEELNTKLARLGETAIQEVLQPLFSSSLPINAISWDQSRDGTTGAFFSTHRVPGVRVLGSLGVGWVSPKELSVPTRLIFNEKMIDFYSITNDIMKLTFGDNVTVTLDHSGHIQLEQLR